MAQDELTLGTSAVDGDASGVTRGCGGGGENRTATDDGVKTQRLPRWTRQEILVLIQGKKVAENKVRRGRAAGVGFGSGQMEPKWASVSSYCKRHGVNRGPVQCRKRWSNLAGDFKRIKEWESQSTDETESFWVMRNDLRRERKLPGFFDKEVYDILDGGVNSETPAEPSMTEPALALGLAPASTSMEPTEEIEPVFDSFQSTAPAEDEPSKTIPTAVPISISEKEQEAEEGRTNNKLPATTPESASTSQEQRKRKRQVSEEEEEEQEQGNNMQNRIVEILERSGETLAAQLEAQNSNFRQDREQRKEFGDSLVGVLNKLADALGRIADKL